MKPNTNEAVLETKHRKMALREIIIDFAPYCLSCSVEYAEFKVNKVIYHRIRQRAKENDLIFDYYENSKGYHVCLTTRDLSDYSY